MSSTVSVGSLRELFEEVHSPKSKETIQSAICKQLKPGCREDAIERFLNYFYAHEKNRNLTHLTQEELEFVFEKCRAAMRQDSIVQIPRSKKFHAWRDLKDQTVICATNNTHQDHAGTHGWVEGWLTAYPKGGQVDLELEEPMFVTKFMVYAVNVKASPRSMELYAKDENDEWVFMRGFSLRDRSYEGSHGTAEFNKFEMFYVLGHGCNQEASEDTEWAVHPLAGPGQVMDGDPNLFMCSKYWRWKIVDSNGAGYVGINDFHLYGRKPVYPAPQNVTAVAHKTGARIRWDKLKGSDDEDVKVEAFHVIAYPGGFKHQSCGGFYEVCKGKSTSYEFLNLSSETEYQFQVVAVDAEENEGMPSRASDPMMVNKWSMSEKKYGKKYVAPAVESEEFQEIQPVILDGSGEVFSLDSDRVDSAAQGFWM